LHFVVLGGVLFALWSRLAPRGRIEVSARVVAGLAADHQRRFGRSPTDEERRALVARYVEDERLYREALARGLDRGDVIVRRRLVQKMRLLLEEGAPPAPTDAALDAYRAAHDERYAGTPRVDFEHAFSRVPDGAAEAFPLGRVLRGQSERDLAARFGASFAASVMALPVGEWSPPLRSSFGWHRVRVTGRIDTAAASRERVLADWQADERARRERDAIDRLGARWPVEERP
jgi:hypothetical protein